MVIRIVVAVLALVAFWSQSPAASAQSAAEVRSALTGMKAWLGNSPQGKAWNEYLRTADLEAELAKGDEADEVVVFGVLARYTSGQPGLETLQVARVAEALGAWHEQMKPASAENLPELAAAAKDQLKPASQVDVAAARAALASALRELNAFLGTGPNGVGWRQALGWEKLAAQGMDGVDPDTQVLGTAYRALSGDTRGVEQREFRVARRAILRYLEISTYATDERSDERTATALASAAEDLAAYPDGHDGEKGRRLGRALGYLRRHGQAERLVAAARRQYCQPNVFVELSDEFLRAGFEEDVDMVSPVRQNILGTDVYGTGRTLGRLQFRLHPQDRRAAFETQLVGTTRTKTTGYNGPVTIYSTGETQLRATTRFLFDANGLTAEPTTSTADVNNTIHSIETGRCGPIGKFIERMAWKKAGQSESLAEEIASERAQEQANREVDRQAMERIVDVNKRYQRRFRDPLLRRDRLPLLHASTTDKAMRVEVLQVDQDQLAAPTPPPAIEGAPLISARMHESAANNFASSVLSGETLNQERIEQMYRDFERPLPEELNRDPDEPAWSMTFARIDPVTLDLRDGGLRVVLRGEKYTSGDRSFEAMNIAATYKIERTDTGVRLVRQGDLVISPPGHKPGERLSAGQISLRRLLTRRFGNLFKPEIVTTGLKMEGNFAELGTLTLSQFACENGWATLGWNQGNAE